VDEKHTAISTSFTFSRLKLQPKLRKTYKLQGVQDRQYWSE